MPITLPMLEWLFFVVPMLALIAAIVLGAFAGLWIDRDHKANLAYRRNELAHLMVTDLPRFVHRDPSDPRHELLACEVVLGNNFFLTFLGNIKMIFGGEVKSFHGLLTRARQEAMTRLMEQAAERGFNALCNVRVLSVDISGLTTRQTGRDRWPRVYIGIIAYGTAYRREADVFPPPAPPTLLEIPA